MLGIDARAARYTLTAALTLLLLCLVYTIRTTLFVFILALLFAYLLSPLVNVIDRFLPGKGKHTPALSIAYIIFIAALFAAVTQIGSRVIEQANLLAKSMPALLQRFEQPMPGDSLKAQVMQKIQQQVARGSGDLFALLPQAGSRALALAGNLIDVIIIPILGFFFLKDGGEIRVHFLALIDDESRRARVDDILADIDVLLAQFMRAVVLLSLATFVSYSIFFSILRVPFSILLAAVAASLEFIPMIGPLTAGAVILIVIAVNGGPVLGALAFLAVYRLFQDYILSPQLMRAGMKLHPLLVLFGVFAGAELSGIPGAFLSVPVLALIRIVYLRLRNRRTALVSPKVPAGHP
ncbi:MAG TPA: AI-2E family transporter [Bryobacteraceae bacterium]|nr:AI-2E family transporter [Bryobacteraceae bacterium]